MNQSGQIHTARPCRWAAAAGTQILASKLAFALSFGLHAGVILVALSASPAWVVAQSRGANTASAGLERGARALALVPLPVGKVSFRVPARLLWPELPEPIFSLERDLPPLPVKDVHNARALPPGADVEPGGRQMAPLVPLGAKRRSQAVADHAPAASAKLVQGTVVVRYPRRCQAYGHEGRAVVEVVVGELGQVSVARLVISSGCNELDAEALRAVRAARCIPAAGGTSRLRIPVRFVLE